MQQFDKRLLEKAFGPHYEGTEGYEQTARELQNGTPRFLIETDLQEKARIRQRPTHDTTEKRRQNGW